MGGTRFMGYLALYRQWRPQRLDEIVGQQHVTKTLLNALLQGKVSHAYLFCGPRGTGKTSTAKVLARAVNCSQPVQGEPCNQCRVCLEIQSGAGMDVIEIDAASNRGIDEIRELKENTKYFPSLGQKRIFIIDEVHMLTNEAFNALLKTLEEPPEHVLFVLATTEPHRVPLTVLSRCQRFDFRPLTDSDMGLRLQEVAAAAGLSVEDEALGLMIRAASGSLRDALGLLDQSLLLCGADHAVTADIIHGILGTVREEILAQLAAGLAEKDPPAVLSLLQTVISEGKDLYLLAGELTGYLRHALLEQLSRGQNNAETAALIRTIDYLMEAEQSMRRSAHPRVLLEMALIRSMGQDDAPPPTPPASPQKALAAPPEPPPKVRADGDGAKTQPWGNTNASEAAPPALPEGAAPQPDDLPGIGIEQVRVWWPEVLATVKKSKPSLYQWLNSRQVWPAELNRRQLVLGVARGEEFLKRIIEEEDCLALLSEILLKLGKDKWQIRCSFYDTPPPGWGEESAATLAANEAINLFDGVAVPVAENPDQNEGVN